MRRMHLVTNNTVVVGSEMLTRLISNAVYLSFYTIFSHPYLSSLAAILPS
jgi:hypothetical protein